MVNHRLLALLVLFLLCCALFMGWNLKGRIWFILELRGVKLLGLSLVGLSIGVSTILFQTISGNRILTPSIMGFDALFLLMQTLLVMVLGGAIYVQLAGTQAFLLEAGIMVVAACLLFATLLGRGRQDLHRMILTGVIFGVLFRSLTSFAQRIIDPNEFAVLQGEMFASFTTIERDQLAIAAIVTCLALLPLLRMARELDVIALGRSQAVSLGVPYERRQLQILAIIAVLVSVSTALVGPVTFLGLLVASLAHAAMGTHQHRLLLPAAGLIAASVLVGGQFAFERLLRMQSTLSILIEFFGGLLFLILVLLGKTR